MADNTIAWIINDDPDLLKVLVEEVQDRIPDVVVRAFADILDAFQAVGRCDLALIDMTTLCPLHMGPAAHYAPIAKFCNEHPGAQVVILSAVGQDFGDEVVERVKHVAPDACVTYVDFASRDALQRAIGPHGVR